MFPQVIFSSSAQQAEACFIDGIVGTHQDVDLSNRIAIFFIRAKGDPGRSGMPLWGHECERLFIGIEDEHTGGDWDRQATRDRRSRHRPPVADGPGDLPG